MFSMAAEEEEEEDVVEKAILYVGGVLVHNNTLAWSSARPARCSIVSALSMSGKHPSLAAASEAAAAAAAAAVRYRRASAAHAGAYCGFRPAARESAVSS